MNWSVRPTDKTQGKSALSTLWHQAFNACSDSWIADFVEASHDAVYVKDTEKYLLANTRLAKWCGLESVDRLIGNSPREFWIEDVCHRRHKLRLDAAVIQCEAYEVKMAEALEDEVRSRQCSLSVPHIVLDFNGFICCVRTTKVPILDRHHKKVSAFITLCRHLTAQYDLSDLFQLYRQHYPDIQAIQLFLKYLQIGHCFTKLPTLREMQILLALHGQANRKKAARQLDISCNTLASHLQHLKDKLIVPDLNEVMVQFYKTPMRAQGGDNDASSV